MHLAPLFLVPDKIWPRPNPYAALPNQIRFLFTADDDLNNNDYKLCGSYILTYLILILIPPQVAVPRRDRFIVSEYARPSLKCIRL